MITEDNYDSNDSNDNYDSDSDNNSDNGSGYDNGNEMDMTKFVPIFNQCLGTCKTPMGCTCKPQEEETEVEIFATAKAKSESTSTANAIPHATPNATTKVAVVDKSKMCTCGKNAGGTCGCKTGGGCKTNGGCNDCSKLGKSNCCSGKNKLEVYDWLSDLVDNQNDTKMVEVQFKNTRKGYYLNSSNIELFKGDMVAVEATPGHDIGEVTLTGQLVTLQMKKNHFRAEIKRVYRIAKSNDLEKQAESQAKEHKTMLRAREMAEELALAMKISDVEYQGDGNKVIFYYIADERVDFRQLIKVYASEFRVKIEMKQIGARQEAGRVGGIGPCGRELCCSSSMSNFVSVSTSAARLQEIPLNPQKLAGQCGKLKCCLNFETDTYVEAQRLLPNRDIPLEARDTTFYHFKTDVLSGAMTYSTDKRFAVNLVTVDKDRVHDVIRMNKSGKRPSHLVNDEQIAEEKPVSHDLLDNESITRFDGKSNNRRNNKNRKGKPGGDGNSNNRPPHNENRGENRDNKGEGRGERRGDDSKRPQGQSPRVVKSNKPREEGSAAPQGQNQNPNPNQNPNQNKNQDPNREGNPRRNNRNRDNRNRPPRNENGDARKDDNKKPEA